MDNGRLRLELAAASVEASFDSVRLGMRRTILGQVLER